MKICKSIMRDSAVSDLKTICKVSPLRRAFLPKSKQHLGSSMKPCSSTRGLGMHKQSNAVLPAFWEGKVQKEFHRSIHSNCANARQGVGLSGRRRPSRKFVSEFLRVRELSTPYIDGAQLRRQPILQFLHHLAPHSLLLIHERLWQFAQIQLEA